MRVLLALSTSMAGIAALYQSWRRPRRSKWFAVVTGWCLVSLSAALWVWFAGAEFGISYAAVALALCAWGFVVALGRESPSPVDRGRQPRVAVELPGRAATWRTLWRAFVALPLAGTASLLASVLLITGLPWTTANRYVAAITLAPIIWGLLAVWVGMTARVSRVALLLTCVSAACTALLFVR